MEAAAHGRSNIGISKSVGQDFVSADEQKAHAKRKLAAVLTQGGAYGRA